MSNVFIRKVILRNYKSIAHCAIALGPLSVLVGPNGAGKSNFMDALRFVSEALSGSLDHALRDRGGIDEVRRRSAGHPNSFGIRLEFSLSEELHGYYAFQIGARANGGCSVDEEGCMIHGPLGVEDAFYLVKAGAIERSSEPIMPPASIDRLYLVAAAGLPGFRPLFDALSTMGFYNLNPDAMRELQSPDSGLVLKRDGRNLAASLEYLKREKPDAFSAIVDYLSRIVPGISDVDIVPMSRKVTIQFRQKVGNTSAPWRFIAENMSDGTLRVLGILTALLQYGGSAARGIPLVGIEEPETAIHPGAAGILRAAIHSASTTTQVIVTSHSPELLDDDDFDPSHILAVESIDGETRIGPVDDCGISALKDRLFTAGELLKLGQLRPDAKVMESLPPRQFDLFGTEAR